MPYRPDIYMKTGLAVFLLLFLIQGSFSADVTPKVLLEKGILLEAIGNEELLMVIDTSEGDGPYWFILGETRRYLGSGHSALSMVSQLSVSPDSRYQAVLSVGEGHAIVEVIDLDVFRAHGTYRVLKEIKPYPGVISIGRWQGSRLVLQRNIPLDIKKKEDREYSSLLLPIDEEYSFDFPGGVMVSTTYDREKYLKLYITNLGDHDPDQRLQAVLALEAMDHPAAIPALKSALAREKHAHVMQALKKAIKLLEKESPSPTSVN